MLRPRNRNGKKLQATSYMASTAVSEVRGCDNRANCGPSGAVEIAGHTYLLAILLLFYSDETSKTTAHATLSSDKQSYLCSTEVIRFCFSSLIE